LFFVSYASSTGDRGPAQRFHADVQKEVRGILGRAPGTGGRLGRAAPSADPDPAVLTCRAMVALYSADYLRDRQCARDWSVFLERMNRQTRKTGRTPAALVGVLWRPEGLVLPRIVADTGQVLDDVGEGYSGRGALRLMQEPGGREGYRTIVRQTAQRVADAASAAALPEMSPADGRTVTACFGPDRPRRSAAPHIVLPSPAGWSGLGSPRSRLGPQPAGAGGRGGPGPAPAAPSAGPRRGRTLLC
jgi:hypothetical protein